MTRLFNVRTFFLQKIGFFFVEFFADLHKGTRWASGDPYETLQTLLSKSKEYMEIQNLECF